jgi:hypothetical protein
VLTGQKASAVSEGKYKLTPSGQEIEADLVFRCYAGIPHSDFLKKHPEVLDERGYVKVTHGPFFSWPLTLSSQYSLSLLYSIHNPVEISL